MEEAEAAASVIANPQTMPVPGTDAEIGNVHIGERGIGEHILTLFLAGTNNTQAIGDAVLDVQITKVNAGNIPAIQTKLQGRPPGPPGIEAAAADEVAALHHGGAAKVVINAPVRVRRREGCAEQDGTTGRNVRDQAILDPVALPAVDGGTVCEEWHLGSAIANEVETRLVILLRVRRGPDGETIITGAARGAIADGRVVHAHTEVHAVGNGVAKAASFNQKVAGVVDPNAGLGVLNPEARDG